MVGCARVMESLFMELDHVNPTSSECHNFTTNRVPIRRPCNRIKGDRGQEYLIAELQRRSVTLGPTTRSDSCTTY